jgi:hypothetical protein
MEQHLLSKYNRETKKLQITNVKSVSNKPANKKVCPNHLKFKSTFIEVFT